MRTDPQWWVSVMWGRTLPTPPPPITIEPPPRPPGPKRNSIPPPPPGTGDELGGREYGREPGTYTGDLDRDAPRTMTEDRHRETAARWPGTHSGKHDLGREHDRDRSLESTSWTGKVAGIEGMAATGRIPRTPPPVDRCPLSSHPVDPADHLPGAGRLSSRTSIV